MKRSLLIGIVIAETLLLVFLAGKMLYDYHIEKNIKDVEHGLLARRVYAEILPSKSYLVTNFDPLEDALREYINRSNGSISVYVENLNNGANFGINSLKSLFPASINKLPIAILILQKVERKELDLDQKVMVGGREETIRAELEKMLRESDDGAFYALYDLVTPDEINKLLNYLSINPKGAYDAKNKNMDRDVSTKDLSNIFSSLYFSTVLESEHSEYLLTLLTNTSFELKKAAGLSEEVKIAHKFGEFYDYDQRKLFHDCGIIYYRSSRVLYCITTQNLNLEEGVETVSTVVNFVFQYIKDLRKYLDENYRGVKFIQ